MIRTALIPIYLCICMCLGGASAGGYAANCLLQLLALPIIGWSLLTQRAGSVPSAGRSLLGLVLLLAFALLLQLVPLPPAFWSILPGRRAVADGFLLLGAPLPWLPLSLAPQATTASALWLLPALATLLGVVRLGAFRPISLGGVIVAAAILGVLVGVLQVLGEGNSPWYFYRFTNRGQAVGFFANGNHLATLLVVAIPFAAAIQADRLSKAQSHRQVPTILVLTWAPLLIIGVGLAINSSMAGLGLGLTAAISSAFLLRASRGRELALGGAVTGLLLAAAVVAIFLGPIHGKLSQPTDRIDLEQLTRRVSITKTVEASKQYLPVGSGSGTFRQIYQQMENPRETIGTFMNHAHCDVVEFGLEAGAPGIFLMLLLLAWWAYRAVMIWRSGYVDYYSRAATIASAAIMVHSCVDYPLRTAAISTIFAASLAIMSGAPPILNPNRNAPAGRHLHLA